MRQWLSTTARRLTSDVATSLAFTVRIHSTTSFLLGFSRFDRDLPEPAASRAASPSHYVCATL